MVYYLKQGVMHYSKANSSSHNHNYNIKTFDTVVFKMGVDMYMKRNSMLEDNIQKSYSIVLVKFTKLLKGKIKHSKRVEQNIYQILFPQAHQDYQVHNLHD